ncbi:hypothetical protein VN23_11900 [Janthinobacterium sp. B9-8]|nr:hypothetical protein VN23_11900 [Janthinobacterium sp. B9-8]
MSSWPEPKRLCQQLYLVLRECTTKGRHLYGGGLGGIWQWQLFSFKLLGYWGLLFALYLYLF